MQKKEGSVRYSYSQLIAIVIQGTIWHLGGFACGGGRCDKGEQKAITLNCIWEWKTFFVIFPFFFFQKHCHALVL